MRNSPVALLKAVLARTPYLPLFYKSCIMSSSFVHHIPLLCALLEQIELPAKLLDYFLRNNQSKMNQCMTCSSSVFHIRGFSSVYITSSSCIYHLHLELNRPFIKSTNLRQVMKAIVVIITFFSYVHDIPFLCTFYITQTPLPYITYILPLFRVLLISHVYEGQGCMYTRTLFPFITGSTTRQWGKQTYYRPAKS